jgi:hypothetical protein
MIIESGVIIFVGMLFLFVKLPKRVVLTLLGWPLTVDIAGAAAAYILHWGTFSGVMAAAVAGMMLSGMTSVGRYAVGYKENGRYVPGKLANWAEHAA